MKMKRILIILLLLVGMLPAAMAVELDYEASVWANTSTGRMAPYMIGSWNAGRITGASGLWQDGRMAKRLDTGSRFSWGAGIEYIAGYGSSAHYDRYSAGLWSTVTNRQASLRLIQCFAEAKYRSIYLLAGMKVRRSGIVDDDLSSGDLTRSNNARPIPGIAAGFVDFQDIPFTNGWLQIDGEIMYGRMTDGEMREKTFNRFTGLYTKKMYYTYKYVYFRTNPSKPLSATIGMQTAGFFGGTTWRYRGGELVMHEVRGFHLRDVWDMFFPTRGGEDYYKGATLGSWDVKFDYRFSNGSLLKAYFEGPWEDGSGIGRENGFDGLWGLQYNFAKAGWVDKVVVEYLDFTNQSGPIHWAPDDNPGTSMVGSATGGDDYYNNEYYGSYCNYGMGIGTPFLVSPVYNGDGASAYRHCKARGFHAAVSGSPASEWSYTAKLSYQRAGGSGRNPAYKRLSDTSMSLMAHWRPAMSGLGGLELTAQVAFDAGKLRGNNFGILCGLSYKGDFTFGKK